MKGYWTEQAMYNVFALSADIVIYMCYYIITKCILRKEKVSFEYSTSRKFVLIIMRSRFSYDDVIILDVMTS